MCSIPYLITSIHFFQATELGVLRRRQSFFMVDQLSKDIWLFCIRYAHFFSSFINFAHVLIQRAYHKWCKDNGFESMLPKDAKAPRTEQLKILKKQTAVNDHFSAQKPNQKPKPYSNSLFEEAAIQWLIETD